MNTNTIVGMILITNSWSRTTQRGWDNSGTPAEACIVVAPRSASRAKVQNRATQSEITVRKEPRIDFRAKNERIYDTAKTAMSILLSFGTATSPRLH